MINHKTAVIVSLIFPLFFAACEPSQKIKILVKTHDNLKNPVSNASVTLNHKQIGSTNEQGIFERDIELPRERPLRIEISKNSASHYYAPYFETLSLSEINQKNAITVEAILYHVPKTPKLSSNETSAVHDSEVAVSDPDPVSQSDAQAQTAALAEETTKQSETLSQEIADEDPENTHDFGAPSKESETSIAERRTKPDQSEFPILPPTFKEAMVIPEFPADINQKQLLTDTMSQTKNNEININISVFSGKKPLRSAEIYLGSPDNGVLHFLCKTGKRGFCSKKLLWNQSGGLITFKIKKDGFLTRSVQRKISDSKKISFRTNLPYQKSLDLFLLHQRFSKLAGVADTDLFINNRKIGKTDSFGHFTWLYQGHHEDLLKLSFKNKDYLPEYYASDFVIGKHQTITKTVTQKNFLKARIFLTEPYLFLGDSLKEGGIELSPAKLRQIIQNDLKAYHAIKLMPGEPVLNELRDSGIPASGLISEGWNHLNLKSAPDFVLTTEIIKNDSGIWLLFKLIDSAASLAGSTYAKLNSGQAPKDFPDMIKKAMAMLLTQAPVTGPVAGVKDQTILFSPSADHQKLIDPGKVIHIYGVVIDQNGQRKSPSLVAKGSVIENTNGINQAKIIWRSPRSQLSRGDMILFNQTNEVFRTGVKATESSAHSRPVRQMSVFSGRNWVGFTNHSGELVLKEKISNPLSEPLLFLKGGFNPLLVPKLPERDMMLTRARTLLNIDTSPPGSKIFLNDKYQAHTPAQISQKPSGWQQMTLTIQGPPGYEQRRFRVNPDKIVSDFTGANAIKLEPERLSVAKKFMSQKLWTKALALLDSIPEGHPDKFRSLYLSGSVRLKHLGDHHKAIENFEILFNSIQKSPDSDKTGLWESGLSLATALAFRLNDLSLRSDSKEVISLAEKINQILKITSSAKPASNVSNEPDLQYRYLDLISQTYLTPIDPKRPFDDTLRKKWLNFMVTAKSQDQPDQRWSPLLRHASRISEAKNHLR